MGLSCRFSLKPIHWYWREDANQWALLIGVWSCLIQEPYGSKMQETHAVASARKHLIALGNGMIFLRTSPTHMKFWGAPALTLPTLGVATWGWNFQFIRDEHQVDWLVVLNPATSTAMFWVVPPARPLFGPKRYISVISVDCLFRGD